MPPVLLPQAMVTQGAPADPLQIVLNANINILTSWPVILSLVVSILLAATRAWETYRSDGLCKKHCNSFHPQSPDENMASRPSVLSPSDDSVNEKNVVTAGASVPHRASEAAAEQSDPKPTSSNSSTSLVPSIRPPSRPSTSTPTTSTTELSALSPSLSEDYRIFCGSTINTGSFGSHNESSSNPITVCKSFNLYQGYPTGSQLRRRAFPECDDGQVSSTHSEDIQNPPALADRALDAPMSLTNAEDSMLGDE